MGCFPIHLFDLGNFACPPPTGRGRRKLFAKSTLSERGLSVGTVGPPLREARGRRGPLVEWRLFAKVKWEKGSGAFYPICIIWIFVLPPWGPLGLWAFSLFPYLAGICKRNAAEECFQKNSCAYSKRIFWHLVRSRIWNAPIRIYFMMDKFLCRILHVVFPPHLSLDLHPLMMLEMAVV